ncbi:Os10g0416350, partial [Oryza sativa Japonica Group]
MGRTRGPRVVMLVLRASPATTMSSLERETPTSPASSSSWVTHPKLWSWAPRWVRTVWISWYLARPRRSAARLERRIAAPPTRNRVLVTSIGRLLPMYAFRVMFSVLTTSAIIDGVYLEEALGEINGDDAGAASHAAEVVGDDAGAHPVAVDDERGEGGRRGEEAGVEDEHADVGRRDAGLAEHLVDDAEDDGVRLLPRRAEAHVHGEADQRRREVGRLPEPRPLQHPLLERHALAAEPPAPPEVGDRLGARRLVLPRRLVAGEVDEVDGARAGRGVGVRRQRRRPARHRQRRRARAQLAGEVGPQRARPAHGASAGRRRRQQRRQPRRRRHQRRHRHDVGEVAHGAAEQHAGVVLGRQLHRPHQLPVHCYHQ